MSKEIMIENTIEQLIQYGIEENLIQEEDHIFVRNQYMDLFQLEDWNSEEVKCEDAQRDLPSILGTLLEVAIEKQLIQDTVIERDLFDTKIMGILVDRPSIVNHKFWKLYKESPKEATDYFYDLSIKSNYIREDRIQKNVVEKRDSKYGEMIITINLAKPELDAKSVERMKNVKKANYPKCFLCKENVGFKGRMNHAARQNLRTIPIELNNEEWQLQYSPYVYFNEHCIVLAGQHTPMNLTGDTFVRLFRFVDMFPHYFIGSNAGLPIIGGSILGHDHYQGGCTHFPIEEAPYLEKVQSKNYESVTFGAVKWPMATLRIESQNRYEALSFCKEVLETWSNHNDEKNHIHAYTMVDGVREQHNGISPVVQKVDNKYIIHIVLRNNRQTEEHPNGLFHQHPRFHHLKAENIGIIETLGQAILPGRIKGELDAIVDYLTSVKDIESLANMEESHSLYSHKQWMEEIMKSYDNRIPEDMKSKIYDQVVKRYVEILEDVSVYKNTEEGQAGLMRFIQTLTA